jgi:hypothetical protein
MFLLNLPLRRADEKRRKQEEKEAKRYRDDGRNDPEYELRLARERDVQSTANRERRKSFNTGTDWTARFCVLSAYGRLRIPNSIWRPSGYWVSLQSLFQRHESSICDRALSS